MNSFARLARRISLFAPIVLLASAFGVACVYSSDAPFSGAKNDGGGTTDEDGGGSSDTDSGSTSSGDDSGVTTTTDSGGGTKDSGQTSGPTWTTIYGSYFAAGTPGHCGDSGCHLSSKSGFKCGSDKATCYTGLVNAGYVSGATSALSVSGKSCLVWFGGNMPTGGSANAQAKTDVAAWVAAGAPDN